MSEGRSPATSEAKVAVILTAHNEAGKIGRTLDRFPRDGRFEAIVIDDGSSDGTGYEAAQHGADVLIRHAQRRGVGAGIRSGFRSARERQRPFLALLAGDNQHEPTELIQCFDLLLDRRLDYVQGSRWMPGGRVEGSIGGRGVGTRLYSAFFSILAGRRVTDATNGFRIFRAEILDDPSIDIDQSWLDTYELEPYLLYKTIKGRYRFAECPVTVRYHDEGYTKMRGVRDWWRLLRPALLLRLGVKR